jgi:hypothetical protein
LLVLASSVKTDPGARDIIGTTRLKAGDWIGEFAKIYSKSSCTTYAHVVQEISLRSTINETCTHVMMFMKLLIRVSKCHQEFIEIHIKDMLQMLLIPTSARNF